MEGGIPTGKAQQKTKTILVPSGTATATSRQQADANLRAHPNGPLEGAWQPILAICRPCGV